MLQLKGCPRCQGALKTNRDMYGEYKECLQCGYMLTKNNKVKAA
jgi:DNA-directed RNA polymerase subunit M/transcription elongation factor TFIIS